MVSVGYTEEEGAGEDEGASGEGGGVEEGKDGASKHKLFCYGANEEVAHPLERSEFVQEVVFEAEEALER